MQIIASAALAEKDFLTVDVLLKSKSAQPSKANVLVFRCNQQVYAYVNHCMHMHRPLNCQEDAVFDADSGKLRCSMHGFLFEPETGTCISPVCLGETLQAIKIAEEDGMIVFTEKQLQIISVHQRGQAMLQGEVC